MRSAEEIDGLTEDKTAVAGVTHRSGISIATAVLIGIVFLIMAAATPFVISLTVATRNTNELIADKSELAIRAIRTGVRGHIDPARAQIDYILKLVEDGTIDPREESRFVRFLQATMAAAPQVAFVGIVRPDYSHTSAVSFGPEPIVRGNLADDPTVRQLMDEAAAADGPFWGEPFYESDIQNSFLNLRAPVYRDGEFLGVLLTAISVKDLSDFLANLDLGEDSSTPFVLCGRDRVLAHEALVFGVWGVSEDQPLPAVASFQDVVLSKIWDEDASLDDELDEIETTMQARIVEVREEGKKHIFLFDTLDGYGPVPLTYGVCFDLAEVGVQYRRLWIALAVGCVMVLVALIVGLWTGKRLSSYSRRLVAVAGHIRELDIEHAPALPGSKIRELNESAEAFNSMVRALRWFEVYVPRKLVRRLIQSGQTRSLSSENRTLTVMFTDISGFTHLASALPADLVADFLNRHFGLIAECVEAEGGTVDKYIGDGVMAFWGAPEDQPDHAARAARAALAVVRRIAADNAERNRIGQQPIRMRIGIHSGPVVVGNIGAPGRVNYTIIGDTVNTAQRLEQLGKEFKGDAAAVVLTSAETVSMMGAGFDVEPVGERVLRGRTAETSIYLLKGQTQGGGTA